MKRLTEKRWMRVISALLCVVLLAQCLPQIRAAEDADPIRNKGFLQPIAQKTEVPEGWTGIYTAADLTGLTAAQAGNRLILMDDILLDRLSPLFYGNAFTGELDGNGHTITYTATANVAGTDVILGLFKTLSGTVRNLHVAGSAEITFVSGTSTGVNVCFGGIAAEVSGGTLENCVSSVVITEHLSQFFVSGSCGGIVGKITGHGTVTHCCNRGEICGRLNLGGICGSTSTNNAVEIYACLNQGKISECPDDKGTGVAYGTCYMGGVIGSTGYGTPLSLHECANLGSISAGDFSGGIAGQAQKGAKLLDCLNCGEVSGASGMSGGIVGSAYACSVNRVVNMGTVVSERCGAIAGQRSSSPTLKNYYWREGSCACAMANTTELLGAVKTSDLMEKDAYPVLDFALIWEINEDLGCPYPQALGWKQYKNAYKIKTEQHENDRYEQYFALLGLIDQAGGPNGGTASVLHKTYRESVAYYANREWSFVHSVNEKLNGNFNSDNPFYLVLADLFNQDFGLSCYEEAVYENILSQTSDLFSEFDLLDVCRDDEIQQILTELAKDDGGWDGKTSQQMKKLFGLLDDTKAGSIVSSGINLTGTAVSFASNYASSAEKLKEHASQYILYNANADAAQSFASLLDESAAFVPMNGDSTDREHTWCAEAMSRTADEMRAAAEGSYTGLYQKVGGDVLQLFTTDADVILEGAYRDKLLASHPILTGILMGVKFGTPLAEQLTGMDEISYYAGMMDCAGFMAESMYMTVQMRLVDYHKDGSYHNETRLKDALGMYFSLQMLACDYGSKWYSAINKTKIIHGNAYRQRVQDIASLETTRDKLEDLLNKSRRVLLEPDAMNGYLVSCPVTVHVDAADGTPLAVQATGAQTVVRGLEGRFTLLGEALESKQGVYSSAERMWIEGESEGTMNVTLWHTRDGRFTGFEIYEELPVTEGCRYTFTEDRAVLDGQTEFEPTERLFNPFVDVVEGAFYYDPVLCAVGHKPQITNGTDETHFSPGATCTRGQVVTFLWRAAGCPEPTSGSNPFTDVKEGAFYYKAVLWAVEKGITKGTSATTFSPNQGCTRGQVVTFLHRSAGTPAPGSKEHPFTDVKPGAFYYEAVLWAVEKGVTKGTTPTTFSPNATCTRGQIVTFLYRAMAV